MRGLAAGEACDRSVDSLAKARGEAGYRCRNLGHHGLPVAIVRAWHRRHRWEEDLTVQARPI